MNPDYSSDIRQVERFIFQHNLYLLTMFEKKLGSLTNSVAHNSRSTSGISIPISNRQNALNSNNIITVDSILEDPVKNLSRDPTKPIWNCVTTVQPKIIYRKESAMDPIENLNLIGKLLESFFNRFKNQHEDQGGFRVRLAGYEFERELQIKDKQKQKQDTANFSINLNRITYELLQMMLKLSNKQLKRLKKITENERIQQQQEILQKKQQKIMQQNTGSFKIPFGLNYYQFILQSARQLFSYYLQRENEDLNSQLEIFAKIIVNNLTDLINCKSGPLAFFLQPKLMHLPLFIHPMLIGIHGLLKMQSFDVCKREEQRMKKQPNQQIKKQKQGPQVKKSENGQIQAQKLASEYKTQVQLQESQTCIFGEVNKYQHLSKIVFINLDGAESQFNLQIAKYMHKSLIYISFPMETSHVAYTGADSTKQMEKQLQNYRAKKCQHLFNKYLTSGLSATQKQTLMSYFLLSQKQLKKILHIFPINCSLLNIPNLPPVHVSAFISFILKEHLYNQILQFNPSLIIISDNQKLALEKDFYIQMVKQFTVIGNYRVVFYGNLNREYMFQEYYNEEIFKYGLPHVQIEQFLDMENTNMIANNTNKARAVIPPNYSLLQNVSIFLKISSGTHSLSNGSEVQSYIKKYKNYKAMSYAGPLIKRMSQQYSNLSRMRMRMNDYSTVVKVLSQQFITGVGSTFDKLFSKSVGKLWIGVLKDVQKIIFASHDKSSLPIKNEEPICMINQNENQDQSKRKKKVQEQILGISQIILNKYPLNQRKQSWTSFKFQKCLQISTQKVEYRHFLHIPVYRQSSANANINKPFKPSKQAQSLICLQFYTIINSSNPILPASLFQPSSLSSDKQFYPNSPLVQHSSSTLTSLNSPKQSVASQEKYQLELLPSSAILYSRTRKHPQALVYITNHLLKIHSTHFSHYYGIVTEQFTQKSSLKVQMFPVQFNCNISLAYYETFTQFGYHQSENFVWLFWPKIYDLRLQLLTKFAGNQLAYAGESTGFIFRAHRNNPGIFQLLHDSTKNFIIPRHGCQVYEPPGANTFYIFGGFYANEKNYLLFQTDITKVQYENKKQSNALKVQNIPKQFYFDYTQLQSNRQIKIIRKIKNDMVRPKVQYQFLEAENSNQNDQTRTVFAVGGVGQNYLRSYSLTTIWASKLTFSRNGNLISVNKIPLNNIVPVNTHKPVKLRAPLNCKLLFHAENRSINFQEGQSGFSDSAYVISNNQITYNKERERFQYESEYQFVDQEHQGYRQQVSLLRRTIGQLTNKVGMLARCGRGKELNANFVSVIMNQDSKYILQLQLQVSIQTKHVHPDLPAIVKLTSSSIISMDINNSVIYCLVRHPIYTLDACILAYFDINQLQQKLKQFHPVNVPLKQLHKFDENVSYSIIIAANPTTIVLLHGKKFQKQVDVPEMIIKRSKKKAVKIEWIQSSDKWQVISTQTLITSSLSTPNKVLPTNATKSLNIEKMSQMIKGGNDINTAAMKKQGQKYDQYFQAPSNLAGCISCSIFINQNNGNILCFSFKSIERKPEGQVVLVAVQQLQLNITCQKYCWQHLMTTKLQFNIQVLQQSRRRSQPPRLLEIIQQKSELKNPLKHKYELIICQHNNCYSGTLQFQVGSRLFGMGNQKQKQKQKVTKITFLSMSKSVTQYFKQMNINSLKQCSVLLEKGTDVYEELKWHYNQQDRENGKYSQIQDNEDMDESNGSNRNINSNMMVLN